MGVPTRYLPCSVGASGSVWTLPSTENPPHPPFSPGPLRGVGVIGLVPPPREGSSVSCHCWERVGDTVYNPGVSLGPTKVRKEFRSGCDGFSTSDTTRVDKVSPDDGTDGGRSEGFVRTRERLLRGPQVCTTGSGTPEGFSPWSGVSGVESPGGSCSGVRDENVDRLG